MPVHEFAALSWKRFAALSGRQVIGVLPMGAIEAHGPHLPLGTDIVIAEAMAREGAARLARRGMEVVVLPALPFAPAPFAAAFAGTVDTPASSTTAVLQGISQSLGRHGVTALVIANAHHDPAHVAAIRAATESREAGAAPIIFPDLTRRRWAERLTPEFRSGACHAGRYETSIVLAESPEHVDKARMRELLPNPASLVDAIARGDRTFERAGGSDAYFGAPAEATAEEGRQIIEMLGAIVEEAVMETLNATK